MPKINYPNILSFPSAGSSINLESIYNIYYTITYPASSSTYTLILPLNSCDGIYFEIGRFDSNSTITLTITGNSIYYNGSSSVSINVPIRTNVIIVSHSNIWYVITRDLQGDSIIPIFSGAFVANNGQSFYTFNTQGTPLIMSVFDYPGSYVTNIKQGYFLVGVDQGKPIIKIEVFTTTGVKLYDTGNEDNGAGGSTIGITLTNNPMMLALTDGTLFPSVGSRVITNGVLASYPTTPLLYNPLPTTPSSLQITLTIYNTSSNNAKVAFYSLRIV